MPRIKDNRVIEGKKNRNNKIRRLFEKRWNEGFRYEVIEEEVIKEFGVSVSTITRILKQDNDNQ